MAVKTISPTKILHQCELCDKGFYPKRTDRRRFCSSKCGNAYTGFKVGIRKTRGRVRYVVKVQARINCRVCNKLVRPSYPHQLLCGSIECNKRQSALVDRKLAESRYKSRSFDCLECGVSHTTSYGNTRKKYCSDQCARKASNRRSRHIERARLANAFVEHVDPNKVFNNADWLCQLCGVHTSRHDRGTVLDTAPELDHVIPLSKGGEHSYRNTQCLCRKCNREKSDTIPYNH